MTAVLWNDILQFTVVLVGLVSVVVVGSFRIGGLTTVWEIAREDQRFNLFKSVLLVETKFN